MRPARIALAANWLFIGLVLLVLYVPMVPPPLFSISPDGGALSGQSPTLRWYVEMWSNTVLVGAVESSLAIALIVGVVTPILGVLAAMAVRELRVPRLVLLAVLLPLFIPGISMGLATAFFFRQLGLPPSMLGIVIVHVLWALPFATLIVLTVMAGFDPVYVEAAYMNGATPWRAFRDIEFPLIRSGVVGAATFSMILSFNETVRTSVVQGPINTVQTYIWSTYKQIGLSPTLYALMTMLIALTLVLVGTQIALDRAGKRRK